MLDRPFDLKELKQAISSSKNRSSPGHDGISYQILKCLPDISLKWLSTYYNHILFSGEYPYFWKIFNVCFIPKGHNKGYRPIALALCLLKIMERMLNDRLMWWIETTAVLPRCFNGFHRGKSCNDCLASLHLDASIAKKRKELLGVLSLDFGGPTIRSIWRFFFTPWNHLAFLLEYADLFLT